MIEQYSLPEWLGSLTHPLVVVVALVLCWLYWRRRRDAHPEEALQLLALILLLRCVLDPLTYSYHHTPFLLALISYDALRRRVPAASIYALLAILATTELIAPLEDAALVNAFYLSWSLPIVAYLALATFAPDRLARLGRRP